MTDNTDNEIRNLDDFLARFPNAERIERRGVWERWYNGEGEGSDYETEWFDCDGNMDDPYGWNFQDPEELKDRLFGTNR